MQGDGDYVIVIPKKFGEEYGISPGPYTLEAFGELLKESRYDEELIWALGDHLVRKSH